MSLTWNETVRLLKVVTAKDRRTVGQADIQFWQACAAEADWPSLQFAIVAVVRHANDNPGVWIEPGHITKRWRELRSEAARTFNPPRFPVDVLDDPKALHEATVDAHAAWLSMKVGEFEHSTGTQTERTAIERP